MSTVYPLRFFAELGGLLAYGNDRLEPFRRGATYAGRILKRTKPNDLPEPGIAVTAFVAAGPGLTFRAPPTAAATAASALPERFLRLES
jgi:hypothetical protein